MKRFILFGTIFLILFFTAFSVPVFAQSSDLLTPQESLWLKSRNDTIVVYPSENSPPYSYKNSAGNPQGLAIDYLELIAQKVGAKIQYLTPRPISQVLDDVKAGKGDVIASLTPDADEEQFLIFTDNYLSSPAVIVTRKDYGKNSGLNLNDFDGKRVAVVSGSGLESYMRINYPRVVLEEVTDDEVGLQQVVLGEVDAASMDVASLSYFLSKQVLNSVKIVGDTGFESKPAFAMPKNLTILQSILEKGMSQISTADRDTLNAKWIVVPTDQLQADSIFAKVENNINIGTLYILFGLGVIIVLLIKRRSFPKYYKRKKRGVEDLKEELRDLEESNQIVAEELKEIRDEESKLVKKIESLDK